MIANYFATKAAIVVAFLCSLNASAQVPLFDSTAYLNHYASRIQSKTLETPYKDNISNEEKIAGLSRLWMEAMYNFANFDLVPALDWDSLYLAFFQGHKKPTAHWLTTRSSTLLTII